MSAEVREHAVIAAGVRSPVLQAGAQDAADAVVLVHGNPGSCEDWRDLVARIGEHGRAVAVTMPGFGRADRPKVFEHTVAGHARHLGLLLERLGVERAHLVLHDFGGPWGLTWAADHAAAVGSVTLVDTGLLLGYSWHRIARVWRTPVLGELFNATATWPAYRTIVARENPRLPLAHIRRMYEETDRGTKRAVLELYRSEDDPAGQAEQLAARLRPLDLPACVVWGADDAYLPVALAERQHEGFPRAEVHVLADAGHWAFVEDPDGVAARVVPFLAAQLGAAPAR